MGSQSTVKGMEAEIVLNYITKLINNQSCDLLFNIDYYFYKQTINLFAAFHATGLHRFLTHGNEHIMLSFFQ